MPVYVNQMSSEVTALQGDLPLSQSQIEALVKLILSRLEQQNRERKLTQEATQVRARATADRLGPSGG